MSKADLTSPDPAYGRLVVVVRKGALHGSTKIAYDAASGAWMPEVDYEYIEPPDDEEKPGKWKQVPPQGDLYAIKVLTNKSDAVPVIRMQPDIQNGGYAAGAIAATATRTGCPLRLLDIKAVQRHLVDIGNLKQSVLTDTDNFPWDADRILRGPRQNPRGSRRIRPNWRHSPPSRAGAKRTHRRNPPRG